MDALRAGGNCLIIHLVASMDMHYVRSALRKTKEQHVYIRGCAYPTHTHTQIIHVLGYMLASIKSVTTLKCQSVFVTSFLSPCSLLYLRCPFYVACGPVRTANCGCHSVSRIAHLGSSANDVSTGMFVTFDTQQKTKIKTSESFCNDIERK